ncbi:unnamed protein product [Adineta ricciae]|uniref:Uncharacterized protein n=1 Tax=Adineta ricciae TaxID=249248 RepID=A0A816BI56_ADIRI|nr:unnamed protein product [Adineta ricciae]
MVRKVWYGTQEGSPSEMRNLIQPSDAHHRELVICEDQGNKHRSNVGRISTSILPPPLRQPLATKKVKNINVQKLAKSFETTDSDIEPISSDDEIYLNQLTTRIQDNTQHQDHRSIEGLSRNGTGVADENTEFELTTAITNDNIDDDLEEPTNEDLVDISDDELVGIDYTAYTCRETQRTVDMLQLVPVSAEQQQP